MVSHIRRCTVFVIVAASGILSATFVASAAPQEEQRNSLASLAAPQGAVATTGPGIPTVAGFYKLPNGDVRDLRVSFVQNADEVTASWMHPSGKIYGRGTYRWDPIAGSFKGTSTTSHVCDETQQIATVVIREELYVVNDRELRDRWTRPLSVDCSLGVMEVFKWTDQLWLATDKDWKPVGSPQESPESLVGAR